MMAHERPEGQDREADAGLCRSCRHARVVRSDRGSTFIRCALAAVDPAFPRYPVLPVLACSGYTPGSDEAATA
jgi:hypothetical protein